MLAHFTFLGVAVVPWFNFYLFVVTDSVKVMRST